jgi:hypothetical protein
MAEPVALGIKPPQVMTLGDMVNIARGAQAYQQSEQANPLVLQKAQMEIEQAQKMNPLAVGKSQEELAQQKIKTESDTLGFAEKQMQKVANSQIRMINNPLIVEAEKNPDSVDKAKLVKLVEENGLQIARDLKIPLDQAKSLLSPYVDKAMNEPGSLRQYYKERHLEGLDAASRTGALNPSGVSVDYGTGGQVTSTNQFSNVPQGTAIPGTQFNKGLAPQLATSETGLPRQYGGGGAAGIVNPAQSNPVLQPPAMQQRPPAGAPNVAPNAVVAPVPARAPAPAGAPVSGAASGINQQFGAKGGIEISPGETVDAYRARVARLSALPAQANKELSLANNDSIPNQEFTNNKVLGLLESKNIRVGKLAEAIANKTGGIGLNSEEQEIQKYLEQRIRQNSLRSNQDENSQKMASGSFGTDVNALRDIIYNDKGLLASQRLLNQGILKYQGNPNKPNLAAINDFENKFNMLNQDRNVTHLLGVVGDRSLEELSKSDVQQLKKVFGGMSKGQMDKLFEKKQELENLVRGAR